MTPELLTAILGAGGLTVIVPKLVDGLKAWRSGRALEEKDKNRGLVDRLAVAESRLEAEIIYRRAVEEYASTLRRVLIEVYGVPSERLPPWPVRN
ncbi:hypothetical protein FDI29_gp23 [Arthrobacter phage Abidatro]|uniref:Uncharacterized protein n=1 Tax=Arthrobacter phage Abidatro TaxID=2015853 RepID=A0A222ZEQ9_9CAUD|nr:hypothetical protein FDI29_gp23 [Arthrobacter phage Abidatro]ASR83193.1 hypothetical protein SEA_ABIDATRO_23 [Arthrobacter phage Abidatro]